MFGVKLEEQSEPLPQPSRRGPRPAATQGSGKKMFFGVEVADSGPAPQLDLPEPEEGTSPSISTVSAVQSKLTVVLIALTVLALSAAAWQMGQLRSARKAVATANQELEASTSRADDLALQVAQLKKKNATLEEDKVKLTAQLAAKTTAYDELAAKGRTKSARGGKSKARRHGRKG